MIMKISLEAPCPRTDLIPPLPSSGKSLFYFLRLRMQCHRDFNTERASFHLSLFLYYNANACHVSVTLTIHEDMQTFGSWIYSFIYSFNQILCRDCVCLKRFSNMTVQGKKGKLLVNLDHNRSPQTNQHISTEAWMCKLFYSSKCSCFGFYAQS